jgi:hypothetical protein
MKALRKIRCWWRLRFGFCPLCYSSPPDDNCVVCGGDRHYGLPMSSAKKERWRQRYLNYLDGRIVQ